jgi:carbonic anhydrase
LDNNKKWAQAVIAEDPSFFENIAVKQEPKILWIGKFIFLGEEKR